MFRTSQFMASLVLVTFGASFLDAAEPVRLKPGQASPETSAAARAAAAASNRFAMNLYGRLRASEKGNLFCSPYSISTALAMTSVGAQGNTRKQTEQTLELNMPPAEIDSAIAALRGSIQPQQAKPGVQLRVANRLWGQEGFSILPEFQQTLRASYGAELATLNFEQQTEAARRTINQWVEQQTENKIPDLLAPGVLDADTRLVLTNAIYFKGNWTDEFKKDATKDESFHLSAGEEVKVPLMRQTDDFRYAAADNLQILELPYGQDRRLAMVVLLPKQREGLAELEGRLTHENLEAWLKQLRTREVRVFLPRFRLASQFSLNDVLASMGMTLAFAPGQADFSGISSEAELYISAVIHQALVDVNEQGTEAAAATAVVLAPTAALEPQEPAVFRADHPFVFLIRDRQTGAILFLGRLMSPQA